PAALGEGDGEGCAVWRQLRAWQAEAQRDARLRPALRAALAELQGRFDQDAQEFAAEAAALHARGAGEELARLAGSFMQHAMEELDAVGARLRPGALAGPHRARSLEEEVEALQ